MPAVRKEGLYFHCSPWESFVSPQVQADLSPLHALAAEFHKDEGGSILLAFRSLPMRS
jgi:hypothetical protein